MVISEKVSRFESVGCSQDQFAQHQENKNTLSKRHVSLPGKFLVSRNELREIENIDTRSRHVNRQFSESSSRVFVPNFASSKLFQ